MSAFAFKFEYSTGLVDALLSFVLPELIITFDEHGLQISINISFQSSNPQEFSLPSPRYLGWLPFAILDSALSSFDKSAIDVRKIDRIRDVPTHSPVPVRSALSLVTTKVPIEPSWVSNSRAALQRGDYELCPTGVGGTYFVRDKDEKIAVFKPIDEEPGAINNPKNSMTSPLLPGGKGAFREVAAYAFDKSFAGVPETHMVEVHTPRGLKKGSLQKFVVNDGDCSDLGANKFSVESVHRIGIFDIRALNMDRNDENLLVQATPGEYALVPIDHTYCFPEKVDAYFNWQFWSQTKKPFSQDTLAYIESIDVLSDANLLSQNGIDEISVRNVVASTILLQKMAKKGNTLFQIASFVSGPKNRLTEIISKVNQVSQMETNNFNNFVVLVGQVVDEFLD